MRIHIINLDRTPERLSEFTAVNSHLTDLARFSAIDGQQLDIPRLASQNVVAPNVLTTFSLGGVGLALSHLALWEHVIATGQVMTICEDDAIFNRHFEEMADEMLRLLPSDWDFISWGWNFDFFINFEMLPGVSTCLAQFEEKRLREGIGAFQEQGIVAQYFKLNWAYGTPCYSVSPKGAQILKRECFPLRPQLITCPDGHRVPPFSRLYRTVGIDLTLNSIYSKMNAFVCFPPLVVTRNETTRSTVQKAEDNAVPETGAT
ncbi:MAG TPA: glycosyltransferase family 25 protein [Pseudolabrys sp.]|nr:glycosyltransferase family 25 protein [Pseudolabrys sp.]